MQKLKNNEINYLLYLLESKKGFKTRDVFIETAKMSKMEMSFLQNKLESMRPVNMSKAQSLNVHHH